MEINLYADMGVKDLGTERNVIPILEKITVNEPNVTLSFLDCGVDYPATSLVLDKVFFELANMPGDKNITILFDFKIHEFVIHKWFFIGSKFFSISEEDKALQNDDFKNIINKKLKENKISMSIEIRTGQFSKKIDYGRE